MFHWEEILKFMSILKDIMTTAKQITVLPIKDEELPVGFYHEIIRNPQKNKYLHWKTCVGLTWMMGIEEQKVRKVI